MSETDRRAERSRRLLWQALMGLLQERDWADINVQAICDRADVARSTFYAHFPTKQDLLDMGFSAGLAEVETLVANHPGPLPSLHWLVGHLASAQDMQRRLQGTPAGLAIMARFRIMTTRLVKRDLERGGIAVTEPDLTFLMGGIFAVLERWLAQGCADPQQTLVASLASKIRAIVA